MKAIVLQFPNPVCKESWDGMNDADLGKHCQVCKMDIFDFSDLTDDELIEVLKHAPQKVCGRFKASQIGRPIFVKEEKVVSKNPRFKSMLAATVMLAISTPFLNAQDILRVDTAIQNTERKDKLKTYDIHVENNSKISGVVVHEDGEPLVGVSVVAKGTKIGAVTGLDGDYVLNLPPNLSREKSIILQFSLIGCKQIELEYIWNKEEEMKNKFAKIEMKDDDSILLGEVIIVPYNKYYDPIYGK